MYTNPQLMFVSLQYWTHGNIALAHSTQCARPPSALPRATVQQWIAREISPCHFSLIFLEARRVISILICAGRYNCFKQFAYITTFACLSDASVVKHACARSVDRNHLKTFHTTWK